MKNTRKENFKNAILGMENSTRTYQFKGYVARALSEVLLLQYETVFGIVEDFDSKIQSACCDLSPLLLEIIESDCASASRAVELVKEFVTEVLGDE